MGHPDHHQTNSFESYTAHIEAAIAQTDRNYSKALNAPDGADQCCIDTQANQQARYKFAGGAVRTYIELGHDGFMQQLDRWAKSGTGKTLKAHKFCGYLLLLQQIASADQQESILLKMQKAVQEWNDAHPNKPPFQVEIDWEHGTAKPFMC